MWWLKKTPLQVVRSSWKLEFFENVVNHLWTVSKLSTDCSCTLMLIALLSTVSQSPRFLDALYLRQHILIQNHFNEVILNLHKFQTAWNERQNAKPPSGSPPPLSVPLGDLGELRRPIWAEKHSGEACLLSHHPWHNDGFEKSYFSKISLTKCSAIIWSTSTF